MSRILTPVARLLQSPDLRILSMMLAGIGICGVLDGSLWKTLLSPTIAYRPAILFGLTLIFGWRGFRLSQLLFLSSFASFFTWQGAVLITLLYLASHAAGLAVARKFAGNEPWLSREKSALAFLGAAFLAPAIPALLSGAVLSGIGITGRSGFAATVDSWLRGGAGVLALAPALLVHGSGRLRRWAGLPALSEWRQAVTARSVIELAAETVLWSATLWTTVQLKAQYGLNITYLTFLPPLAFTIFRGMQFASLALAANAVIATTLWYQMNWSGIISAADLRLLLVIYSVTILVLAAVVEERQRGKGELQDLAVAEAALRASEEHFRTLANSVPVMIWMIGTDKLCKFSNQPWLNFTGYRLEEKIGHRWDNILHPEDVARTMAAFEFAFASRGNLQIECRFRRADGEYRWMLASGVPLYRNGQFDGYIGSCVDITSQRLAAEKLSESEAQLAYAQRLAKVGSFERNIETGAMHWSEEKLRILGLAQPPPNFAAVLACVHPNDRQKFLEMQQNLPLSDGPTEIEYRIVRPNNEVRVVRSIIEGIKDDKGDLLRVVGSTQDITDQVEAEQRLQQSEELLRRAQHLAHVGSWHWDLETNLVACSEECLRILGQTDDFHPTLELFLETVMARDRDRLAREIKSTLVKRALSTEFQITRPNGDIRTIKFDLHASLNEQGLPRHVFGACQDVTDIRRAQEQAFARQKLETVGTLANGIAHEFNNLLGGVLAQTELAFAEIEAGSDSKEQLEAIRDAAMRGADIVRELMIYAGTENSAPTLLDVSKVVEDMLALLRVSISKQVELHTELARNVPLVRGNSARILQLVMNLVTNASEAMGERGGSIRVITRAERDHVILEVSDEGCGMEPELLARIFEPFFSTKSTSRGLGLSVVEGIVRRLGGTIQVRSEADKGSVFQICLPAAMTDSQAAEEGRSVRQDPSPPATPAAVLLVEDEDQLREAVSKLLANRGFSVIEAAEGSAALDVIRSDRRVDLLILDITIPGPSSREVFEAAQSLRPAIKVIVASAYPEGVAAQSLHSKIPHFMRKPYRINELTDLIRQALS